MICGYFSRLDKGARMAISANVIQYKIQEVAPSAYEIRNEVQRERLHQPCENEVVCTRQRETGLGF